MFKKLLPAILIGCLVATLVSGCAGTGLGNREEDLKAEVAYETVEDTELTAPGVSAGQISITLTAPEGWTKQDAASDDTGNSSILCYEKDTASISVIEPLIPKDAKSAMDVAGYEYQQIKASFQEAEVSEPVETTLDGTGAARMELNIAISADSAQKQIYVYFFKNGAAYKVMGTCFTTNPQDQADIESMLQSIKIL